MASCASEGGRRACVGACLPFFPTRVLLKCSEMPAVGSALMDAPPPHAASRTEAACQCSGCKACGLSSGREAPGRRPGQRAPALPPGNPADRGPAVGPIGPRAAAAGQGRGRVAGLRAWPRFCPHSRWTPSTGDAEEAREPHLQDSVEPFQQPSPLSAAYSGLEIRKEHSMSLQCRRGAGLKKSAQGLSGLPRLYLSSALLFNVGFDPEHWVTD